MLGLVCAYILCGENGHGKEGRDGRKMLAGPFIFACEETDGEISKQEKVDIGAWWIRYCKVIKWKSMNE